MKRISILLSLIFALGIVGAMAAPNDATTKKERNFIKAGNKAYADSNFVKATEEFYRAYNINPSNDVTIYNIATSQMATGLAMKQGRQANSKEGEAEKLLSKADSIYSTLFQHSANKKIREKAAYNSGNIHFRTEDYKGSIEQYKNALRLNPDNDKARHNLRLAQLKLQNQQNDDKQDQNNEDQKEQEQQQDQQQQQQQQQDQQQQQQNQPQQQNQDQQQQQQQYNSQNISKENAEQILNAMENAERRTRQNVKEDQKKAVGRKIVTKPW